MLVVDDEIAIADTLAIILSKNGFAAITAYEGKSALEIARIIPPDLLLSDVAMPEMTGVALAITLHEQIPDCRVLLFSGQSLTVDILSDARAMGYDFPMLTKPIHPSVLLESISRCLQDYAPTANSTGGLVVESAKARLPERPVPQRSGAEHVCLQRLKIVCCKQVLRAPSFFRRFACRRCCMAFG